jgi:hypothetical protein
MAAANRLVSPRPGVQFLVPLIGFKSERISPERVERRDRMRVSELLASLRNTPQSGLCGIFRVDARKEIAHYAHVILQ